MDTKHMWLSIWERIKSPGYTENRHWMGKVKISLFRKMSFFSLVQTYFWEAVETFLDNNYYCYQSVSGCNHIT